MFVKKTGLPQESEIVLCTVTKIQFNSVFVVLNEYDKPGMVHISEVSPGRIRNLRDFVEEGKLIVCKVLRVDPVRGHIDLSLRRVSESQRREKASQLKQEQLAEKIIEFVAKETGADKTSILNSINAKIKDVYETVYAVFQNIAEDNYDIKDLGLEKKLAEKLEEAIKQRIKPKEVEIKGELKLETYASDGIEVIKHSLLNAEKTNEKIGIYYEGGGKYTMKVKAGDYKEAEDILKKAYTAAISYIQKNGGTGEFVRSE